MATKTAAKKPTTAKSEEQGIIEANIQPKVMLVPTELIDDNPYNPRRTFPEQAIDELGDSLIAIGMRQIPTGRKLPDGRVQIAFGHMRLRAIKRNKKNSTAQKDLEQWSVMPLWLKDLTDRQMFDFALTENLRRTGVTPIEVARAIQTFSDAFPDVKDKEIGKNHGMTEANVSNMKRVLRLPERFLTMIDKGALSFTQGRELLTLIELPEADKLMDEAVMYLDSNYPNTVEGIQMAISHTVEMHYRSINIEMCPSCTGKSITTHPGKGKTLTFCLDHECLQKKMEAVEKDILELQHPPAPTKEAPKNISQEKSESETGETDNAPEAKNENDSGETKVPAPAAAVTQPAVENKPSTPPVVQSAPTTLAQVVSPSSAEPAHDMNGPEPFALWLSDTEVKTLHAILATRRPDSEDVIRLKDKVEALYAALPQPKQPAVRKK